MHSTSSARVFSWFCFSLDVYIWMIILRIIISWIVPYPQSSVLRLAIAITDPGFTFLQKLIPPTIIFGMYLTDVLILVALVIFLGLKFIFFRIIPGLSQRD